MKVLDFLKAAKKPSFAAAVGGGLVLPALHQLTRRGDVVSIRMDERALKERLDLCKHSLIARLVHLKGDVPLKFNDLRQKLAALWFVQDWKLISFGKGFYQVLLHSGEDRNRIWALRSMSLKPGVLQLQAWDPDFNPKAQKAANAQVWVRFYGLNWVYWHRQILSNLARGISIPLHIDNAIIKGERGLYARILIDVDLSTKLPLSILFNREGGGIKVIIHYENFPLFCSACNNVEHAPATCRRLDKQWGEARGNQSLGDRNKQARGVIPTEPKDSMVADVGLEERLLRNRMIFWLSRLTRVMVLVQWRHLGSLLFQIN